MADLKTYPISDLRIRVEVQDRLWHAHGLDASGIVVAVCDHEVRLSGGAPSPQDVRRAVAIAADVEGVKRVRDHVAVRLPTGAGADLPA